MVFGGVRAGGGSGSLGYRDSVEENIWICDCRAAGGGGGGYQVAWEKSNVANFKRA